MATRQLKQAGLLGAVLGLAVAAAGCTSAPDLLPTPTSNVTPTAIGATGPFGTVQVNQTFVGRAGMTVTVQEATKWVPAPQFWAQRFGWVRVVGVRVVVDTRPAKAAGTTLDNWPSPYDPVLSIFGVVTLTNLKLAHCYGLYHDSDPASQARDLSAFGGDVAFSYDEDTDIGEGWIICGTTPDIDSLFDDEYAVSIQTPDGAAADGSGISDGWRMVMIVP